jgi:hypothetical protein
MVGVATGDGATGGGGPVGWAASAGATLSVVGIGTGVLVGGGGVLLGAAVEVLFAGARVGALDTTVLDGDAGGAADELAPSPRITTTMAATPTANTPPAAASHHRRSCMKLTSHDQRRRSVRWSKAIRHRFAPGCLRVAHFSENERKKR